MPRRVLSVGQCDADHWRISQTLGQNFDVEIDRADTPVDALRLATETSFDLILINRLFDLDGSPGLDVLQSLKSNPATHQTPVMLVSNFADAQDKAVEAGAIAGFGKAALDLPETIQSLSPYLAG